MRSATTLTFKSIRARPVVLKLKRPVIARIATITDWPLILIDLFTNEGVVGRSYLEPYTVKAMKYLVPALHDLGDMLKGRELAPVELYELARKSLHFVGYQGLSMIAVSGLDLAAWDARAKAANVPLCVFLGGSVGPVRAYNSNGLWLKEPSAVAAESIELRDEGGFTGLKLRLGRDRFRDDLATIEAVRNAVGNDTALMIDFNQGLNLADALQRCHAIDISVSHGLRSQSSTTISTVLHSLRQNWRLPSRSVRISMVLVMCTQRSKKRRATSSCLILCGSAESQAG